MKKICDLSYRFEIGMDSQRIIKQNLNIFFFFHIFGKNKIFMFLSQITQKKEKN